MIFLRSSMKPSTAPSWRQDVVTAFSLGKNACLDSKELPTREITYIVLIRANCVFIFVLGR